MRINIRNLWPFRSFANFTLTVIGVSGVGLLYSSVSNQSVFSNSTVVNESIKQLGANDTLRNLIGNPIEYSGVFANSYNILPTEQYYNFQIKGPKSKTTVQLNATKIQVKQINNKIQKVKQLSKQILAKQQQQLHISNGMNKLKKQQKLAAQQQLQNLKAQIQKLRTDLDIAEKDKILTLKKYYIPDVNLDRKLMKNKTSQDVVPENEYLFGIDGLVANLPNRTRITVLPLEQTNIEPSARITKADRQRYAIQTITDKYIMERQQQTLRNISQDQLESYSKHKTMGLYSKYGGYRMGFTLIIGIGIMMVAVYWHLNRLLPLGGTIIAYEAEQAFINHPRTVDILKKIRKTKNEVKFSNIYLGGRKGDYFTCKVDVQGLPDAKIEFEGKVEKQLAKFSKLTLQYREGKEIKKVDLLA